jgi:hypothetical protein
MSLAAYWIFALGFVVHHLSSWVSFSTIVSVTATCSEASALIAGMIVGLTDLSQYINFPNTCCVLIICFYRRVVYCLVAV